MKFTGMMHRKLERELEFVELISFVLSGVGMTLSKPEILYGKSSSCSTFSPAIT